MGADIPVYVPVAASILNGALFAPLELVSTRSKSAEATTKGFRLLFEIARKEGMAALWKGSGWFITGTMFSRGIWLASYDRIKNRLHWRLPLNQSIIGASLLSGMSVALLSNPIWTLKTYAQLPNYPGLFWPKNRQTHLMLQPRVLMSGSGAAMTYVGIESVSQLFLYEYTKRMYQRHVDATVSSPMAGLIGGISRAAIIPFTYPLHVLTLRYREQARASAKSETVFTNTKLQTAPAGIQRQNLIQIVKTISEQRAWYDGMSPYMARVIPQATVLFFCYEFFQRLLIK